MPKDDSQKTLKELQMEELKASFGVSDENAKQVSKTPVDHRTPNKAKIAKLFEDAAEYEEDLEAFEAELAVIHAHNLAEISEALIKNFPDYEGDYPKEIQAVISNYWKDETQLEVIKNTIFPQVIEVLKNTFCDYQGDFEVEIKDILIKRWEMIVEIKKEHVKEELAEMKSQGMKPDHIRKVYRLFHGLDT
jgi:hypothetical protein